MVTVAGRGQAPLHREPLPGAVTHEVLNQSPPRPECDEFRIHRALVEGVQRYGAGSNEAELSALGQVVGGQPFRLLAELANRHAPTLRTHDRYGRRIDEVDYHPAYHQIMTTAIEAGAHSRAWVSPGAGAQVAHAARFMLLSQVETGHGCPTSMTYASVPVLRHESSLAHEWEPLLTSRVYDPRPVASQEKQGALVGMAMTEKQGGSDVRANTTVARPAGAGGLGREYLLTGHKWFCSAPMSDAFMVLAQLPEGISCFLVPRLMPDGTANGLQFQGLKDKLGNRSNASGELELLQARGWLVGEPGRGVASIIEMVSHTRLSCVYMSAAGMREGVAEAVWHASHRAAFGRKLRDQPLMAAVLADLCVESEAATVAALRLAHAYEEGADDCDRAFRRLATAVVKYWVCKRGPGHAAEALECLGGNGYVETFPLARRYREQPLMSVWEGSGNVMCLDVLRAVQQSPESLDAFIEEVERARGTDRDLDALIGRLRVGVADAVEDPRRARLVTEQLALALQGSLLVRHAPPAVADAFCTSRLSPSRGLEYGANTCAAQADAIITRAAP